ncbi:hypothetical protein HGB13_00140 [bacterium]|nr:hypothetical protein [bacterium]
MSKNTLTLEQQNNIIAAYLKGESKTSLAKEYSVNGRAIRDCVENRELRTVVEKKHIELTAAREARRIDDIKDQILTFISQSLTEASASEERKILFMDKVSKMISDLDRISRLNREQATSDDRLTTKTVKVDVAEVIKALDTPEKKKDFLRAQLITNNDNEAE